MSHFSRVLTWLLLALSISMAVKIPSKLESCREPDVVPKPPYHCHLAAFDALSPQNLRRDEIDQGPSSIASDLSSVQAQATNGVGQIIQSVSDAFVTASTAVDGAAHSASTAIDEAGATISAWIDGTFNDTASDANDVHDWLDRDTNGMSNKALLGVIIAIPVIVILAMGWFCWWCCRRRRIGRQSAQRGAIINIGK
ncbi:hypothetical protein QBC41DRAFT_336245 [Cercophora samala]|uniref:Uncharacterized protein n=1 Tax=Cercophora samala TaxID=330535 RepID=A0AA39ZFK2_9PEZI|nr:hypothetical protein QBC41DRAFT_336245 [Cercophora samala]